RRVGSGAPMKSDPARPIERPRYCPSCRERRPDEATLCAACGETLDDQGFCAICESYWLLPIGSQCPKHEVTLGTREPDPEDWGRKGELTPLVTVGRFARPGQAEALRIR